MSQFEPKLYPVKKKKKTISCDKTEQMWTNSVTLAELLRLPGPWIPPSKTGAHGVVINHKKLNI